MGATPFHNLRGLFSAPHAPGENLKTRGEPSAHEMVTAGCQDPFVSTEWNLTTLSTLLQWIPVLVNIFARLKNEKRPETFPTCKETWSLGFHCHFLPSRDKTRGSALPLPTRQHRVALCSQI